MEDESRYSPISFVSNEEAAGAISDGFRTRALPAAIAPTTGSSDNTGKELKIVNVILKNMKMAI